MAFFDEVGKKISQAGQTAVQKTKDITDLARLNGNISEEEKKINNSYTQIGKLYYAMHQNDCEEDFKGFITAIRESENKIVEYRQQIQDIKGIVRCEKCGAESPNTATFCSSCGATLPKQTVTENEDAVLCSRCGKMVAKDARFCTSCGNPMSVVAPETKQESKAEETITETEPVKEEPAQSTERKCSNCGAVGSDDALFCTECGTKF